MSDGAPKSAGGCGSFTAGAILGALVAGTVCLLLAAVTAEWNLHRLLSSEKRDAVEPAIRKDRAFKSLGIHDTSDGGIVLIGTVATEADEKRLHTIIANAIGEHAASIAVSTVRVNPKH